MTIAQLLMHTCHKSSNVNAVLMQGSMLQVDHALVPSVVDSGCTGQNQKVCKIIFTSHAKKQVPPKIVLEWQADGRNGLLLQATGCR